MNNPHRSPDKPGKDGYVRVCLKCGSDMHWCWGGEITYFKCDACERIEPCANIIYENGTVTVEEGNKKLVYLCPKDEFLALLKEGKV